MLQNGKEIISDKRAQHRWALMSSWDTGLLGACPHAQGAQGTAQMGPFHGAARHQSMNVFLKTHYGS